MDCTGMLLLLVTAVMATYLLQTNASHPDGTILRKYSRNCEGRYVCRTDCDCEYSQGCRRLCLEAGRVCDGTRDCPDGDDEEDCCDNTTETSGQWSRWSYMTCTNETCAFGQQTRTRICNNPPPIGSGAYCVGNNSDTVMPCTTNCSSGDWDQFNTTDDLIDDFLDMGGK